MTIGRQEDARRGTLDVKIEVGPGEITLALAQLLRDRWAAERRELGERQGTLHVLVTGH